RVGTTSLPLVTTTAGAARTSSLPDMQGSKAKYATMGRRNAHTKPRNLYKVVQLETRNMVSDFSRSRSGIVSMEECVERPCSFVLSLISLSLFFQDLTLAGTGAFRGPYSPTHGRRRRRRQRLG